MIKIAYNRRIDTAIISDAEKQFQLLGIKTESKEQKDGVYNGFWWTLAPLVGIWIAKPYLDGFLNELGKDSAGLLKRTFREVCSKLRNSPVRFCNRSDLEKIDNGAEPMSVGLAPPALGIGLQIEDAGKHRWALLCIFPANLSEDQLQKAIEQMQSYLPSAVELERKYLADLKKNQIVLGSHSYIYDLDLGWVSEDKLVRQMQKHSVQRPKS